MIQTKRHSAGILTRNHVLAFAVVIGGFSGLVFGVELAWARVGAVYSVPTVSPELAAAAEYTTRSDQDSYGSPDRTGVMRFSLPAQLTGLDTEFELNRQSDGSWVGAGTDGSTVVGQCGREDKKWFACQVAFTALKFDSVARTSLLESQFGRGFEFQQRTEVAQVFEGQPIGIIRIRIEKD